MISEFRQKSSTLINEKNNQVKTLDIVNPVCYPIIVKHGNGCLYMDEHFKITYLFDIYGPLLTEKQSNILELYLNEDLTISEIADELSVSRQAAFDLIKRTEANLLEYDGKLMLFEKYLKNKEQLDLIAGFLESTDNIDAKKIIESLKESL